MLVPRDHRLAARDQINVAELAGERIISAPSSCPWETDFGVRCQQAGFEPMLESCCSTDDIAALQAIVATGHGITLVPELATRPEHPGIVTPALIDGPVRHVRIAVLAGATLSLAGAAMVELLQDPAADTHAQSRPPLTLAG